MTHEIAVSCLPAADGWACDVRVGDDPEATEHRVTLTRDDVAAFAPQGTTPEELVRESFGFLLEREPRGSILPSFELPVIGRYFADYPTEILRRLGGALGQGRVEAS